MGLHCCIKVNTEQGLDNDIRGLLNDYITTYFTFQLIYSYTIYLDVTSHKARYGYTPC